MKGLYDNSDPNCPPKYHISTARRPCADLIIGMGRYILEGDLRMFCGGATPQGSTILGTTWIPKTKSPSVCTTQYEQCPAEKNVELQLLWFIRKWSYLQLSQSMSKWEMTRYLIIRGRRWLEWLVVWAGNYFSSILTSLESIYIPNKLLPVLINFFLRSSRGNMHYVVDKQAVDIDGSTSMFDEHFLFAFNCRAWTFSYFHSGFILPPLCCLVGA